MPVAPVQSPQAASSPFTKGNPQAGGDTGFLATLDGILQSTESGSPAASQVQPAQATQAAASPVPDMPAADASDTADNAGEAVDEPVKSVASPAQEPVQAPSLAVAKAPAAPISAPSAGGQGSEDAASTPAVAVNNATLSEPVSAVSDIDLLTATLSQAQKFPAAVPATPVAQPASPAAATDDLNDTAETQIAAVSSSPPASDAASLPTPAKSSTRKDEGDVAGADPANATPAQPDPTLMLATVASQIQAVQVAPEVKPVVANADAVTAVQAGGKLSAPAAAPALPSSKAALVSASSGTAGHEVQPDAPEPAKPHAAAIPTTDAPIVPANALSGGPQPAASSGAASGQQAANNAAPSSTSLSDTPPAGQAVPDVAGSAADAGAKTKEAAGPVEKPASTSVRDSQGGDLSMTVQSAATSPASFAKAVGEAANTTPATPAEQVSLVVQKGLADGRTFMTIALDPGNLGKVEVNLDIAKDGSVQASVVADNADTLTLLKNDHAGLSQALHNAGLSTDSSSLNFSLRSDSQNQSFAQAQQQQQSARNSTSYRIQASIPGENTAAAPISGTQYALSSGNSRVDLFV